MAISGVPGASASRMFGARVGIRVSLWRRSRSGAAFRSRCSTARMGLPAELASRVVQVAARLVGCACCRPRPSTRARGDVPLRSDYRGDDAANPAPARQPPPVATIPAVLAAIIVIDPAAAHRSLVDEDQFRRPGGSSPAAASPQVLPEPEESNPADARRPVGRSSMSATAASWPYHHGRRLHRFRRRDRRAPPLVDAWGCRRANAGNGSRGMGRALAVDDRQPGLREYRSAAPGKRATRCARATPAAAPAVNEPLRQPSTLGHPSVLPVARPVYPAERLRQPTRG